MSQKRVFDVRFSILVGVQLLSAAAVIFFISKKDSQPKISGEFYRNVASKLHSAGVTDEASKYYEKYLQISDDDPKKRAKIAYSIAEMHDNNQNFDRALSWYYQVEQIDAASSLKADAAKRIVAILEKTNRLAAAKRELGAQTQLSGAAKAPKGAVPVAKIGERQIYLHEVTDAMASLPQDYQKAFDKQGGKKAFLRKFIADEVLYEKALRLNYLDDEKVKKQMFDVQKQILVQKIIEQEVQSKVKVEESDVKNYFDANSERYDQKEQGRVALIKVKNKSLAEDISKKLKSGEEFSKLAKQYSTDQISKDQGGKSPIPITQGSGFDVHGPEVTSKILALKPMTASPPILSKGAYYLFQLTSHTPAKKAMFEDLKARVEYDYKMEKSQTKYQKLIEETLAGANVQIFDERLN